MLADGQIERVPVNLDSAQSLSRVRLGPPICQHAMVRGANLDLQVREQG
ncbi:MAG: hypothetical protein ACOH10_12935 [Rhodoglobus sp.]